MKLVKKIKSLFRKQPLTDDRITALAEAESTATTGTARSCRDQGRRGP
jgi:hypothetical protein